LGEVHDLRSVDTGLALSDGKVFVWGNGYYGMNGSDDKATRGHTSDDPPHLVHGLPQGSLIDVAGGIYNFNALDRGGYVWGWGWHEYRDGTQKSRGNTHSTPPARLRLGGNYANKTRPYLSGIKAISSTEMAGAGIAQDGRVYSWGHHHYGGTTPSTSSADVGAALVQGLPDPALPGNMPTTLKGGYTTFWVVLENGDVYYFGGQNDYERPLGDEPTDFSGTTRRGLTSQAPDLTAKVPRPVYAMKSAGLDQWTRANSPDEYIVQVVSGIYFGGALLSSGRVLTWGSNGGSAGALGRTCGDPSATPSPDYCNRNGYAGARTPGFAERVPAFGSIEATFTAFRGLTPDGELWGWSAKELSYCGGAYTTCDYTGLPKWPPVKVADNVEFCQAGQGYLLWETFDGRFYGIGYNVVGALGHTAYNGNAKMRNNDIRELVFFPVEYWDKTASTIDKAIAQGKTRRHTLDECLRGLCT
jgi:alpha-tubulin suppressor-like RCC1 family protein